MKLIDKDALLAEIERLEKKNNESENVYDFGTEHALKSILSFIDTLEVKEVDFNALGAIARHFIAVKEHIGDMRLYKDEWLLLEKIGYPERFKSQKGE